MRHLVFRPQADADLAEIWRFTEARWNIAQADAYTARLIEVLEVLPGRPVNAKRCDDLYPGLWRLRYGAHIVFFIKDLEVVTVVRILHERRDQAPQLRDLLEDNGPSAES